MRTTVTIEHALYEKALEMADPFIEPHFNNQEKHVDLSVETQKIHSNRPSFGGLATAHELGR